MTAQTKGQQPIPELWDAKCVKALRRLPTGDFGGKGKSCEMVDGA